MVLFHCHNGVAVNVSLWITEWYQSIQFSVCYFPQNAREHELSELLTFPPILSLEILQNVKITKKCRFTLCFRLFWEQTIVTNCDGEGGLCFWYNFLMLSFHLNFWLFIINLLVPAFPLDGSRVFINCLRHKYDTQRSAKVYCWATGIIAVICILLGATVFRSQTMLFFIGIWAAFQVYQMTMLLNEGHEAQHPLFR